MLFGERGRPRAILIHENNCGGAQGRVLKQRRSLLAFRASATILTPSLTGHCRPGALPESSPQFWETAVADSLALLPTAFAVSKIMALDQVIETEGKITSVLAGTMFRVELANQHSVLAHISGKMRKRFIRLTNGDRVKLEMSPYDLTKARIVYRLG